MGGDAQLIYLGKYDGIITRAVICIFELMGT